MWRVDAMMGSVFIVGAGGVGKTTLVDQYMLESGSRTPVIKEVARKYMAEKKITQNDLKNQDIFWKLQCAIVSLQLQREKELEGKPFISDRSALDPLIYAAILKPHLFPILYGNHGKEKRLLDDNDLLEKIFTPLLDGGGHSWRRGAENMLERYRTSLVFLLHPFAETVKDDGVRKVMSSNEMELYTSLYGHILRRLGIPFLDIREVELSARLEVLRRAMEESIVPSPLETLEHYANVSSKRPDREAAARHYQEVNLPFFLHSGTDRLRCLSLSGSELRLSFVSSQPGRTSRFLDRYGTRRIFLLEFEPKVPSTVVCKLLEDGVKIQGRLYSFLGCSSSGLKKRKCFLWNGSSVDADRIRQENGDFSSITTVSKRIARFSLLLSNVVSTNVAPVNIITEPDIENDENGCNFTDGCGSLSRDLADSLFQKTKSTLKWPNDKVARSPSAYQVRFQGYKGVLSVDSRLGHSTIVVRPSMKKFTTSSFPNISVCDYSRPFSFGHLNRQYILLLSALGVPDEAFRSLQMEHFKRVRRMLHNYDDALMLLEWRNRAEELLQSSCPPFFHLRSLQQRLIAESLKLRILVPESRTIFGIAEPPRFCPKTGNRLPGLLQPGECFVRVTVQGRFPKSLQQSVVVSKNPCYLLGDVRVLRAISEESRPALREISRDLVDVIVFPIEGTRPHSEEIAGSDLDGDQYFVCWDTRLIPPRVVPAYSYPSFDGGAAGIQSLGRQKRAGDTAAALVRYFSIQNVVSQSTGRVDALFRAWSNLKGASCSECERLGQLFSRVVDSAKSGEVISIPNALVVPKEQRPRPSEDSKFVWQRMEFAAQSFVDEQQERQAATGTITGFSPSGNGRLATIEYDGEVDDGTEASEDVDEDSFLLDLVSRNHLVMSEFTKFRLVMEHFGGDVQTFFASTFSPHVNFGLFSAAERGFAVEHYGVPVLLLDNALRCYSRIVGFRQKFLSKFLLDAKVPWCLYWQTVKDENIVSFPRKFAHALRNNTDVLLLLQVPDGVVIILCFSRPTMTRRESDALFTSIENGCVGEALAGFIAVHAYFASGNFGYSEKYPLEDQSYKIDLSENGLQLYRGEHGQTFVNLKVASSSGGRKGKLSARSKGFYKGKSVATEGDIAFLQISVDLTRFNRRILTGSRPHPLVRKTPIYEIEIFAYNRRTDYSNLPSRKTTYLDVIFEDSMGIIPPVYFDHDVALEDDDTVSDLVPNADDLLEIGHLQLLGDHQMHPLEWTMCFASLLRDAQVRFGLFDCIPQGFRMLAQTLAEKMTQEIIPSLENCSAIIVDIITLLDELGIETNVAAVAAPQMRIEEGAETQLSTFVRIVRRWDVWLTIKSVRKREQVLAWLETHAVDASSLEPLQDFVFHNTCVQANVLLSELLDGNVDSKSSAAISRLGNLRLDPAQPFWNDGEDVNTRARDSRRQNKKKLPLITLYRLQAIPMHIRWAIGEYVCISRQAIVGLGKESGEEKVGSVNKKQSLKGWSDGEYENEFPPLSNDIAPSEIPPPDNEIEPKQAGFFLARVVRLCQAPFSMTVKLVASSFGNEASPELLSQCLEHGKHVYWQVNTVPANVVTHVRVMDAIEAFLPECTDAKLSVAPEIHPFLFSTAHSVERVPVFDSVPPFLDEVESLNQAQLEAVRSSFLHRASLVHGPPGTGKTTTAVQIMIQILKHSNHRLLVCAETNLAVDNLATRFLQECTSSNGAIRVGGRNVDNKNANSVEMINLESLVRGEVSPKPGQEFHLARHKKVIDAFLERSRIVFTTCAGAGDPLLDGQLFQTVLMDEASMSTEPGALCPLAHGCRHFVLIGDHKQLGPHAIGGTCLSLFESLAQSSSRNNKVHMTLLNEQHRMHPALCSFPSRVFYDGKLVTAAGTANSRRTPQAFFGGKDPVRFVNVPNGHEERVGSGSWYNEVEISSVLKVLKQLLFPHESSPSGDTLAATQITVLTPYRAQQMKIREHLSTWRESPEVNSVDGFQGRENEIVVVSTVRCGGSLGFCNDERRMNVLLTRAKRGLVIVGNRETLSVSPLWSSWLKEACEN